MGNIWNKVIFKKYGIHYEIMSEYKEKNCFKVDPCHVNKDNCGSYNHVPANSQISLCLQGWKHHS